MEGRLARARVRRKYHHAFDLTTTLRQTSLRSLLIAVIFVQACLIDIPTARAFTVTSIRAIENPPFFSLGQNADSKKILDRASLLLNEIKAASYPELRGAAIQVKLFKSQSDYFHARFAVPQFLTGRRMRYIVFINAAVFTRRAPEEGVRAILAHELAHVLYFRRRNRLHLLGLVRLASKGFTARFERRADLQAIARGSKRIANGFIKTFRQRTCVKRSEIIFHLKRSTRLFRPLKDALSYWPAGSSTCPGV